MRVVCMGVVCALTVAASANGQTLRWELVADVGSSRITNIVGQPGVPRRLFVTTQEGEIWRIDDGVLSAAPVLDITNSVNPQVENGLLGLAFHPDVAQNGRLFICYVSIFDRISTIDERRMIPSTGNVSSNPPRRILRFGADTGIHRGGWLGFGPDGMLYVGSGDHDLPDMSRDPANRFGTLMRIDVDGDDFPADDTRNYTVPPDNPFVAGGGDPLVWQYGLRNPWRCYFDTAANNLYIGDVGGSQPGEINVTPLGQAALDFGWPCYDGFLCLPGCDTVCDAGLLTFPQVAIDPQPGCATIAGAVYSGCALPQLRGRFFYTDLCDNTLWSFRYADGRAMDLRAHDTSIESPIPVLPTTMGVDTRGELYMGATRGEVFRLAAVGGGLVDCNGDGIADPCQLASGALTDANDNGIPDACDCPADAAGTACDTDLSGDCLVDQQDLALMLAAYLRRIGDAAYSAAADLDRSGQVDFADLGKLLADYLNDCR